MGMDDWDFAVVVNAVEVLIWSGMAVMVLAQPLLPGVAGEVVLHRWLAAGLFAFGLSDAVEIWSGAWWRPWWLLVWKMACIVLISTTGSMLFLRARTASAKTSNNGEASKTSPPDSE